MKKKLEPVKKWEIAYHEAGHALIQIKKYCLGSVINIESNNFNNKVTVSPIMKHVSVPLSVENIYILEEQIQIKLAGKTAQMMNTETWTFHDGLTDIDNIFFNVLKLLKENWNSWSLCMNTLTKCFEKVKKIIFEEKQILDLLAAAVFLLGRLNKTQINYIFQKKNYQKN